MAKYLMTEKRTETPIRQKGNDIHLGAFVIPMSKDKEYVKVREKLIWEMYGHWCAENPDKKCYNENLKRDIYVTFSGISETVEKAARNYKSTMAFWKLDFVLKCAYQVGEDKPQSKRQKSEKYEKILIMQADTSIFKPHFDRIKLTVGVKKSGRTNMYCITAIEKPERIIDIKT